jgi:hypothetical protein
MFRRCDTTCRGAWSGDEALDSIRRDLHRGNAGPQFDLSSYHHRGGRDHSQHAGVDEQDGDEQFDEGEALAKSKTR